MTARPGSQLGAVALLLVMGVAGMAAGGRTAVRAFFSRIDPRLRSCAEARDEDPQRCFGDLPVRWNAPGMRARLGAYQALVRDGSIDDCHMLAHELGHRALAAFGDPVVAIRAGTIDCVGGYVHGIVEAALHHAGPDAAIVAARLCVPLRERRGLYDACAHGLGHGLLAASGTVDSAIAKCASLNGRLERARCEGGVMMQNSMRLARVDEGSYRRRAPAACDSTHVRGPLRSLCYDQIGEIAMMRYGHDTTRVRPICEAIGLPEGRTACLEGARREGRLAVAQRGQ